MFEKTDLRYSAEHEWVFIEDDVAQVGITEYAVSKLGDIVYVDMPEAGTDITAGECVGEIESTKSVSEIYTPVSGKVLEVNEAAVSDPSLVNSSPEDQGWLFKVEVESLGELMDWEAYQEHTKE